MSLTDNVASALGLTTDALTSEVSLAYSELTGAGMTGTIGNDTVWVQSTGVTSTSSGSSFQYADSFLYAYASGGEVTTGTLSASVTGNLTSADHGTFDFALDFSATSGQLAYAATVVNTLLQQAGLSLSMSDGVVSGNSLIYTTGVQDAAHNHGDVTVTATGANTLAVHADYHLVA